jgi:Tfp pilus assembly PilM family ATPase
MARMIAFDLGSHAVKVAVYAPDGKGYALEGRYSQAIPQDGSVIPSWGDRLAALDMLAREHPEWASAHTFVVAWPSQQATVRRTELPLVDRAQIEKTLPFAIEGEVPFDLEDMLLAWRSRPSATEGASDILSVIVRREPLADLLRELASRAFDPRFVYTDVDVLSGYFPQGGVRTVAILDIGHAQTAISVVHEGRLDFARSVSIGGRAFTKAIQSALGCSWYEAERLKHGDLADDEVGPPLLSGPAADTVGRVDSGDLADEAKDPDTFPGLTAAEEDDTTAPRPFGQRFGDDGFEDESFTGDATDPAIPAALLGRFERTEVTDPGGAAVADGTDLLDGAMALPDDARARPADAEVELDEPASMPANARAALDGAIGQFLAEVRSTLILAEDALGHEIDEVWISGGGSRLPELLGYLREDLGVTVLAVNTAPEAFGVVDALARRSFTPNADGIDLRVGDLAYRGGLDLSRDLLTFGGTLFGTYLLGALLAFLVTYKEYADQQAALHEHIVAQVTTAFPEVKPEQVVDGQFAVSLLTGSLIDAQEKADVLGQGMNKVPPTVNILYQLSTQFPPHEQVVVDLDSIDITPNAITLSGQTDGFASVATIEERLKATPGFEKAQKSNESKTNGNQVNFTITVDRETPEEAAEAADEAEAAAGDGSGEPSGSGEEG